MHARLCEMDSQSWADYPLFQKTLQAYGAGLLAILISGACPSSGAALTGQYLMTIDWNHLGRIALALAIGAVGGFVFTKLTMPLPWMLGAMLFNTVAALMKAPVAPPVAIRPGMVLVLGVLLGSGFTPDMMDRAGQWVTSLGLLAVYIAAVGAAVVPFYMIVGGFDRTTAYFSGMPGGLQEMLTIGHAMGGNDRMIALTHASRILLVVFAVAFWFRLVEGLEMGDRSRFGVSILDVAPLDLLILAACGAVGWPLARLLRFPAPMLVGPMLVSAAVHMAGLTASKPPIELVNFAQLILGTIIGCRFQGTEMREFRRVILLSLGATGVMMAVTALFTWIVSHLSHIDSILVLLAYSPGGLAEMSLVALALQADVAYVAMHHTVRIALVVIGAPLVFRIMRRIRP